MNRLVQSDPSDWLVEIALENVEHTFASVARV